MKNGIQSSEFRVQNEILAVVMARGGSVGLPGKALRQLLGKPVIAYSFEHVRASRHITRCVVSSDSPEILDVARRCEMETLLRPPELATATSATDPVLRHAVHTLYPEIKNRTSNIKDPAAVVMLYGNVPIRGANMIDRCIEMLFDTGCDSVQTVSGVGKFHPYWMFDRGDDGKIRKHVPNNVFRRQDLPPLYSPTGAVYVIRTEVLMSAEGSTDPHAFLGTDRRGLVVASEDSVDIDSEKDLYVAEAMIRAMDK